MAIGALFSLSLGTAATATYAWYEVSSRLLVSNLNIDYNETFLKIGLNVDGVPTYNEDEEGKALPLTKEFLKANGAIKSDKLQPVSSMYQSLWFNDEEDLSVATPKFRTSYDHFSGTTKSLVAGDGFYQFDVAIFSSRDALIYLDEKTTIAPNYEGNSRVASRLGLDVDELNNIDQCLRVSFYSELVDSYQYLIYEPNVKEPSHTKFGGRLNIVDEDHYFDEENGKEILYGEYNSDAELIYSEAAFVNELSEKETCFNALSMPGTQALDIEKSIEESNLTIKEEETYTLVDLASIGTNTLPNMPLCSVHANSTQRMVITIYIEGWDLDCTEDVASSVFDVNLSFSGVLAPIYDL